MGGMPNLSDDAGLLAHVLQVVRRLGAAPLSGAVDDAMLPASLIALYPCRGMTASVEDFVDDRGLSRLVAAHAYKACAESERRSDTDSADRVRQLSRPVIDVSRFTTRSLAQLAGPDLSRFTGLASALASVDLSPVGFEKAETGLWRPDESGLAAHVDIDALLFFASVAHRAVEQGATFMAMVAVWWVGLNLTALEPDVGPISFALTELALLRAAVWLNNRLT